MVARGERCVSGVALKAQGISVRFPNMGTLSSISFRVSANVVRTIVKTGKTNGSALVGILTNSGPSCAKSILCGKGIIRLEGPTTTGGLNVRVMCRRISVTLVPALSMTRGMVFGSVIVGVKRGRFIGCKGVEGSTGRTLTHLGVSVSMGE